ncbi:nitrogen fixation protein NifQ [Motiliproteus sp. SC1-56]|uniref:nitrogen fixation protein NifQ n=1 Tax=Motiliproteus sp. SC1-56 TaxID=2799565 RepID=UPI001A8D2096|nr:nitrogen fixation protein NifQ [Motiliproteus sp. SC1-56]
MNGGLAPVDSRDLHHRTLLRYGLDHPNTLPLAEILSSWQAGFGVMPDWLGLGEAEFDRLHRYHFGPATSLRASPWQSRLDSRLDDLRDDLRRLLLLHARDETPSTAWIADILVTACQGSDHLWQDLGLWNRASLSRLLHWNFPALAARNTRDMKWKKFLFKQLCETEGIYICRAPSCEACCDFDDCFGPE